MLFSVMTKNFNWEISTKNLVTFNDMGVHWKIKKFQYYGSSLKDPIFTGGEVHQKIFFLGGAAGGRLDKKEKNKEWCFWGWEVETPNVHYESEEPSYWHKYPKQLTL